MPKLTVAQRRDIIDTCRDLLSAMTKKRLIKQVIKGEYGLQARQIERYLSRARDEMMAESDRSVDEHRADAYHFYLSVLQDSKTSIRSKLLARERIDKLYGLEKHKLEVTGGNGSPLFPGQSFASTLDSGDVESINACDQMLAIAVRTQRQIPARTGGPGSNGNQRSLATCTPPDDLE